jgi:hypothetical protein
VSKILNIQALGVLESSRLPQYPFGHIKLAGSSCLPYMLTDMPSPIDKVSRSLLIDSENTWV